MPRITREVVEHVATLARLSLSDDEAARMASELDTILEYARLLEELDTSGVEPTSHAVPLPTPMREDRPLPALDPELALGNAPERQDTAFAVPRVIGDEDAG
jgi:aspartyl-tRNA(Asn)/glutamyl-tRNA(Gln) amidotransferase subunit C